MSTLPFNLIDAVNNRYSMRTFKTTVVDAKTRIKILDYAKSISNPLENSLDIFCLKITEFF